MFIDHIEIDVLSGKGGEGCTSFRKEKFVINGGPDGGDGGAGGNIYIIADGNNHTLSKYRGQRLLKADNGKSGESRKKHGKSGKSLYVSVPPGTTILDADTDEIIADLKVEGDKILVLEGGKGGMGNWHFKSSTNQAPTYHQPGLEGEVKSIKMELRLIADVGLVGFPNVGKSTLIANISNAKPQIADYEFTTLSPNLGVIDLDYTSSFLMADIPGIIEGASDGKGLGIEFLRHIERTNYLLFMLDIFHGKSLMEQYNALKIEIKRYSETLNDKQFAIAITKTDVLSSEDVTEKVSEFIQELELAENNGSYIQEADISGVLDIKKPNFILQISSVNRVNLEELKAMLYKGLN